jgi:selenocysteine lyase/cysteine desulfurase
MTYTHKITTPFGVVSPVNADYTASGAPYDPIETFIRDKVLPYYANTHSNAYNGQLMANYIAQSKDLIRKSVGAKECDKVIFTGTGCSGAIIHLIHTLNLRVATKPITVVFITVAEHHSNYLPWQHLPVKVVVIPMLDDGKINTDNLVDNLKKYANNPKICCFIAGSNVTGVLQPVDQVSQLVHRYNGLIFWDYAGCAPYVTINMHKNEASGMYFDGIVLSPHKFLGGPGTPGVLVANCKTFRNNEPFCPGGGTVRFVCKKFTQYNENLETRETGGTPNIIGCIKAGLVFQVKDKHIKDIIRRNHAINKRVLSFFEGPQAKALGITLVNPSAASTETVPIYSFRVKDFHYNYIVVLLNDLFGVQSRGGVSCCSLYAQHLLHLKPKERDQIYHQIADNKGVPASYGWCRVTFHYTMTNETIDFILDSIKQVAEKATGLLKEYRYIPDKNNWVHKQRPPVFPVLSLNL